jgi:hypothetical protein
MSVNTVDKRFALIANNGDILYPFEKSQESTNRYGFAVSKRGGRDDEEAYYTRNIKEVVRHLVFDGWKARVTTIEKVSKQRSGSMGIGLGAIAGYWIADEFRDLVAGAKVAPSLFPGSSTASDNHQSRKPITHSYQSLPEQSVADSDTENEKDESGVEAFDDDSADTLLLDDLDQLGSDADDNTSTERMDNRMSRIGQGKFRKNTIATWGGNERCAVTGIAIREVLTASHIIPWSKDVVQRKRGCNGILLTAHLDRLFDRHLIGFRVGPEGNVFSLVVAPRLADRFLDLDPLGVTVRTVLDLSTVNPADRPGLETNLRAHLELVLTNK